MSTPLSQLSSWDLFFYYGQNDLDLEIEADLMLLALQPLRSLLYNNKESGGINEYENYPNDIGLQVNVRYEVANAVAWKNFQISNGEDGLPDRRIAVSQNSLKFTKNNSGELAIEIFYIPYYDYTKYNTLQDKLPGV